MEITKGVVIAILCLAVVIEALIIWALSERQDGKDRLENSRYEQVVAASRHLEKLYNERQDWKNAYQKEKRLSDHRARRIESIYRGQVLKATKNGDN